MIEGPGDRPLSRFSRLRRHATLPADPTAARVRPFRLRESARPDSTQGKPFMKTLISSLFAAAALLVATSAFAKAPAGPISLPAKPGAVAFRHDTHTSVKCTGCHTDEKGGPIDGFGKTMNKDKAHAACHDCHKKEGKGPQKCADCHKKG